LYVIPDYDIRYYQSHPYDKERILEMKGTFLDEAAIKTEDGLKFPGFIGQNPEYKSFYAQMSLTITTPPRGNILGDWMVCGIAPGDSAFSFGEPNWLLGPSSKILHELLLEHNIYPYFTNIFKKPFPKNALKYPWPEMRKAIHIYMTELDLVKPKKVLFLGGYTEYDIMQAHLKVRHIPHISIAHPSHVSRFGVYADWSKHFKEEMEKLDGK
jgi:uracil-DNA glycosylase family 4